MDADFLPFDAGEPCGCGSGTPYGACCSDKRFKFGRDRSGAIIKRIDLVPEAVDFLATAKDTFSSLYGRDPDTDELVFATVMSTADSVNRIAREMLKAGMSADIVYAYCRSDGLLPIEDKLDFFSEQDLEEFSALRDEFEDLMERSQPGGSPTAAWFVLHGNSYISEAVADAAAAVGRVLNDLMSRHRGYGEFAGFEIKTPLDYGLFSARKTAKTLHSLVSLQCASLPDAMYALARGLFENYLYLNAITADPSFFEFKVLPKADRSNFSFATKDGKINYNRVVHVESGQSQSVWVGVPDLLRYADKADTELFDLFYVTACQFVHVDVLSARAYFHDADPFDELDPATIAMLVSVVLAGHLLRPLSRLDGVDVRFASDVDHFLGTLHGSLSTSLQIADADPVHRNAVYKTLLQIVDGWAPPDG